MIKRDFKGRCEKKKLSKCKVVCKTYDPIQSAYQIRNCYMVDHSKRVIAFYNGASGGTKNTIAYANRKGVEVINILNN